MPVIRIDDEVMSALRNLAVKWDHVFGTPNQVLRRLVGLDDGRGQPEVVQPTFVMPAPARPRAIQTEVGKKSPRVRGDRLLRLHPDLLGQGLKPYADRDGIFYEWPKKFPAIFFDRRGYKIFRTEESMLAASQYWYPETRKVNILEGINSVPGYVTCPQDCPHRRMYRSSP